jgi:glutaredoxin-dependent peroxiredoxin
MALLRDRSEELRDAGVRPHAISRDSPWTHIAWLQALDLDFPLLSDWNAEAVQAFGVTQEFRGMKDVAERSAFIVGRDGVVRFARRYANDELPDFEELLAAARGNSAA